MIKKPRVCLVKPEIYKADGALRIASSLLSELCDEYEFDLVGIYGEANPYYKMPNSVSIHSLNKGGQHLRDRFAASARQLRSLVKQRHYDLVVCVGCSTFAHALAACLATPSKIVLWEHMNFEADDGNLAFRKLAAKHSDAIVVLTNRDKNNYIAYAGKRDIPVLVIPNWVDVPSPPAPTTGRHAQNNSIVSVGRLSQQKGPDLLIEVASALQRRNVDFTWDYYGTGELEDEFKDAITSHQLEGNVNAMGAVPDVVSRLSGYSAFVLTSRWEGLPMVLLESLSQGTPPIAFDIPTGPADIIDDGVNGFLIEPFDIDRMAEAIEQVLGDDDLRARLSGNSEKSFERFDKRVILARWRNLLGSLCNPGYCRIS